MSDSEILQCKEIRECGYVYVLQTTDGMVKIGKSTKPEARVKGISSSGAHKVDRFHISDQGIEFSENEKRAHRHFRSSRVNGEWFGCDFDEAVEYIRGIEFTMTEGVKDALDRKYKILSSMFCGKMDGVKGGIEQAKRLKNQERMRQFKEDSINGFLFADNVSYELATIGLSDSAIGDIVGKVDTLGFIVISIYGTCIFVTEDFIYKIGSASQFAKDCAQSLADNSDYEIPEVYCYTLDCVTQTIRLEKDFMG